MAAQIRYRSKVVLRASSEKAGTLRKRDHVMDTVVFDDSTGCSLMVARNAKNQHLRRKAQSMYGMLTVPIPNNLMPADQP